MSKDVTRRAALEMAAASAAYLTLPILPFELEASAASKRANRILREISRLKLGTIKRWHREKPSYGFEVLFDEAQDALPIISDFNSRYGSRGRKRIVRKWGRGIHWGIDINGPIGTPVIAAHDGEISPVTRQKRFAGTAVKVKTEGLWTEYWHLNRAIIRGKTVRRGDIIGTIGKTGNAPIPHLHLILHDVWADGWNNPHLYWYGGEDLASLTFGDAKTKEKARIIMYRPGKEYPTEYGNPRILTYPVPGLKDMPYFLDLLEKMKRKK